MLKKVISSILCILVLVSCSEITEEQWVAIKNLNNAFVEVRKKDEKLPSNIETKTEEVKEQAQEEVLQHEREIKNVIHEKKEEEKKGQNFPFPLHTWLKPEDCYKNGFILLRSNTLKRVKAVIPSRFETVFNRCDLRFEDKLVDRMIFSGFANPDFTKKERQHWNGTISILKLPKDSFLNCDGYCWRFRKISTRID